MTYCGIDFGTSNSTIGGNIGGKSGLIPLEKGKTDIPTALFYSFNEDEFLFGREAIHEYIDGEFGRFMRALKSVLGTPLMKQTTQIKEQHYDFTSLISIYLKELKTRAQAHTGKTLENVVIGRPVHFVDNHPDQDRDAQNQLQQAAKQAGFKNIEFQFEPIAAALDFEQTLTEETLALIADIGGGTSDFTIIRLSPCRKNIIERGKDILATTGVHIGGTDVDKQLNLHSAMPLLGYGSTFADVNMPVPSHYFHKLSTWHLINFLYGTQTERDVAGMIKRMTQPQQGKRLLTTLEKRLGHLIAFRAEQSKIALSEQDTHIMHIGELEANLQVQVTRRQFEDCILADAQNIQHSATKCLTQAGIKAEDIGAIFLTGGTTGIPLIKHHLLQVCPNARVVAGDKFGSVGTGLTLQAERLFS